MMRFFPIQEKGQAPGLETPVLVARQGIGEHGRELGFAVKNNDDAAHDLRLVFGMEHGRRVKVGAARRAVGPGIGGEGLEIRHDVLLHGSKLEALLDELVAQRGADQPPSGRFEVATTFPPPRASRRG